MQTQRILLLWKEQISDTNWHVVLFLFCKGMDPPPPFPSPVSSTIKTTFALSVNQPGETPSTVHDYITWTWCSNYSPLYDSPYRLALLSSFFPLKGVTEAQEAILHTADQSSLFLYFDLNEGQDIAQMGSAVQLVT